MSHATSIDAHALVSLDAHLREHGRPPLPWAVAHLPDGDLSPHWASCTDARILARLAERFAPRLDLARALIECVTVSAKRAHDDVSRDAAKTLAASLDGHVEPTRLAAVRERLVEVTDRALRRAADERRLSLTRNGPLRRLARDSIIEGLGERLVRPSPEYFRRMAPMYAATAARCAHDMIARDARNAYQVVQESARAIAAASEARRGRDTEVGASDDAFNTALAELAQVVRRRIPCPTLAQLIEAPALRAH